MSIQEASFTFNTFATSEFERSDDGDGMNERIREWLATPQGTVAHDPSWGHTLRKFKHDPLSVGNGLDSLIEMDIARKLPEDIDDLQLLAINVEVLDIDLVRVLIIHQYGESSNSVSL